MIDPVIIRFGLQGVPDVTRALATIEDRMARAEAATSESVKRGASTRVAAANKEAAEREKASQKLAREVERDEQRATKAAEKAEREKTRDTEKEAARREAIVRRSSEMAGRYAAQQAREEIREAERATSALEREHTKRARLRNASLQSMGSSVARGISGVGAMATQALSVGGGFLLGDVVHEQLKAGRLAAQLVNVVTTGKAPPAGANVANILGQATQVATETGMSKTDLVSAALNYAQHAKGGDFRGAMANMGFFAKMSQVTGASIEDIAMSAGTLQSQNQSLGAKEMQQMLLDVYAQGKMGSMSMVDVAKQMGTLGSQRSTFTGDVTRNQRELMALGQIVAPGGDIAEAGTFTKDLAAQALVKQDKLRGLGVKYKNGLVDMTPTELVAQVFKGTHGDLGKIEKIFENRGGKVFGELEGTYTAAGGGDKGVAAVRAKMAEVAGATMTPEQLEQQHQQTMDQPIEKFSVALERLKDVVAQEVTPWIEKFSDQLPILVPKIATIAQALGDFASTIINNPVPAALALFAKEMGGAPGMLAGALVAGIAAIDWAAAADRALQRQHVAQDVNALNETSELNAKTRTGKLTAADVRKAQADAEALREQGRPRSAGALDVATAPINELLKLALRPVMGEGMDKRAAEDARARKNASDSADLLAKAAERAAHRLDQIANAKDPARHTDIGNRPP
jgi:hypothetical protein